MLSAPITPETRWPEQNVLWPPPPQQSTRRGIHGWAAELRGRRHGLSLELEQLSLFEEWYFVNDSGADARFESLWYSQYRRKFPRWLRLWSCSCQKIWTSSWLSDGRLVDSCIEAASLLNSTSSMSYLELAKRASIRWCREKCHPKISGMLLEELPKSVTPGHWNIQTCTAWDVLGCLEASVFLYPMERGKNRTSKIDKHTQARAHSML